MAERRMFAKTIIDSDAFLDMPLSAQALYFHLSMRADDDGFVNNPKKIQRMIGATEDDYKLLIAKSFVLLFESGVIVIKHWRINNYIRGDRKQDTVYTEEYEMLSIKENGSYTLENTGVQPNDNQVTTMCQPNVSIGKNSIDKDSIDKNSIGKGKGVTTYYPNDELLNQTFLDYIKMRKTIKAPMTDRAIELCMKRLDKLSGGDNDTAIAILNQSIEYSWKGIFELKDNKQSSKRNLFDELRDA